MKKNLYDFYNHATYIADTTSSLRKLTIKDNVNIWKKFFVSPSFMIQNSSKNTFEKEINNFRVFSIGIGYKLFSDFRK